MQLDIRGSNVRVTPTLHSFVEKRVRFALSRFGERVGRVRVHLSDANGPRRGVDRICKVTTKVRGAPTLVIEQREPRLTLAVQHAVNRLARRVAHTMERVDERYAGLGHRLSPGRSPR